MEDFGHREGPLLEWQQLLKAQQGRRIVLKERQAERMERFVEEQAREQAV